MDVSGLVQFGFDVVAGKTEFEDTTRFGFISISNKAQLSGKLGPNATISTNIGDNGLDFGAVKLTATTTFELDPNQLPPFGQGVFRFFQD